MRPPDGETDAMTRLGSYRGLLHNLVLCVVCLAIAALLLAVAAFTTRAVVGQVACVVLALPLLYLAVWAVLMRVVATPDGVQLRGPVRQLLVPWREIAEVVGADAGTDAHVLTRRAPVLVLRTGRRVRLYMVSSYRLNSSGEAQTRADRVAAELERLRAAYSR